MVWTGKGYDIIQDLIADRTSDFFISLLPFTKLVAVSQLSPQSRNARERK